MFEPMHEHIPEGEARDCRVEHFDVDEKAAAYTRIREAVAREIPVPVGRYCRLFVGRSLVMSDTPFEQDTNREFVRHAWGDVLIAGLGLGVVLVPVLQKMGVSSVTVIEKHRGVIELVGPAMTDLGGNKLRIELADIFTWRPPRGAKWHTIYFDIWPNTCVANLEDIAKLKRRFQKRKMVRGWMGAWQEDRLRYLKRAGRWR